MTRDGRIRDHGTVEPHPQVAGERSSEVIARYGFHRSTIYDWCKAEHGRGNGNGLRALASCPATGRPSIVTSAADASVGPGKNPRKYGFDVGMWTRHIVREVGDAAILNAHESSLDRRGACPTKSHT